MRTILSWEQWVGRMAVLNRRLNKRKSRLLSAKGSPAQYTLQNNLYRAQDDHDYWWGLVNNLCKEDWLMLFCGEVKLDVTTGRIVHQPNGLQLSLLNV